MKKIANVKGRAKLKRAVATHLMALEPRMMFDGAAVATAADTIADASGKIAVSDAAMARADLHDILVREGIVTRPLAVDAGANPHPALDLASGGLAGFQLSGFGEDRMSIVDASAVAAPVGGVVHDIIFIDTNVADYQVLATEWADRGQVVLIDGSKDGVDQIRTALTGMSDISAIHIVSHGENGSFMLGTTKVDSASLAADLGSSFAAIGAKLSADGDILLYGCNVGNGEYGQELVAALSDVTRADIAASDDLTGAAALAGDWDLEVRYGAVEATTLISDRYAALLQLTNSGAWTANATGGTTTIDGVGVTITLAGAGTSTWAATTNQTFNNIAAFTNGAQNTPSLGTTWSSTNTTDVGTLTITFSEAVTNPILNIDRLGGNIDPGTGTATSNGMLFTVTTAGATLTKVAGVTHLEVTGTTITRTQNQVTSATGTESNLSGALGTAAGSVRVNGTFTTLTFGVRMNPVGPGVGLGDGIELGVALDAKPDARDDTFRSNAGNTLLGNLFANNGAGADTDIRGDALTVTRINGAAFTVGTPITLSNGSLTITNATTGAFTFVPAGGFTGLQTFTYTIADANGGTDVANVNITVNAPPVVDLDYNVTVPAVTPITPTGPANLLVNGSFEGAGGWVANSGLEVSNNMAPYGSPVSGAQDGSNFNELEGGVLSPTSTPASIQQTLSTTAGSVYVYSIYGVTRTNTTTGNDRIIVNAGSATSGTVSLSRTAWQQVSGSFTATGSDVFKVSSAGSTGTGSTAAGDGSGELIDNAIVQKLAENDAQATNNRAVLTVSAAQGVLVNDSNIVNTATAKTVTAINGVPANVGNTITLASGATLKVNADGSYTFNPNGRYDYLAAGQTTTETFTYTMNDGDGNIATATNTITITGLTDVSAGTGYTTSFTENGAAVSIASANVSVADRDDVNMESGQVTLTNPQTGDVLLVNGSAAATGTLTGGISYTRTATSVTFTGSASETDYANAIRAVQFSNTTDTPSTTPRTVNVTVNDGEAVSNTAVATINVLSVNDAPAGTDKTITTNEDTAVTLSAADFGFSDVDGNSLLAVRISSLPAGSLTNNGVAVTAGQTISLADLNAGNLKWTPAANANGTGLTSFNFQVQDNGGTANGGVDLDPTANTITFNVNPVNDTPTISVPATYSGNEDTAIAINGVTLADVDAGTSSVMLTITVPSGTGLLNFATTPFVTVLQNGTNSVTLQGQRSAIQNALNANALTFTPTLNSNGAVVATFVFNDRGNTGIDPGTTGTATSEEASTTATINIAPVNDAPVAVGSLTSKVNVDGASGISVPTAAAFSDVDNATLTYSATGLPAGLTINAATGVISGTIDRSASQVGGGAYTVVVTATDAGGLSATQSFGWTVTNPAPVAANDTASTNEDTPINAINVLGNDADPDGDPLTVTAASAVNGTVVINPDGTLKYTPNANFNGTDTITYSISDGQGGTSTARVTVTVNPVNDAPTPVGSIPSQTSVDAAAGISVATASKFADIDNATLTYSATGLPAGLTINPTTGVISGTIDRSASQVGGGAYTVVVTATDAGGLSATQSFGWTVTNPAPTATNDSASTNEDTPVTIAVLSNDSDPDGDPLSVISASAAHGSVVINPDGTLTYTPNANFNGADTITYRISDGQGGFANATVAVTVNPVNDAPTTTGLAAQANLDSATVTVATAASFTDLDGNTLTYSAAGLPAGLSINAASGVISGTIDHSASQLNGGVYNVTVTANDGNGGTVSTTFAWTVTNPGPTAVNDSASTPEDTPVTIAVLANDSDPDGDALTITSASALHGTVAINPDGTITYTPNPGYNGPDKITYTITDSQGGTSTAGVTVSVADVNDPPTASAIANQTNLDSQTINLPVGTAFADPDGDTLTFGATGLPAGLTINPATGVISGTIDHSASQVNGGVYNITVTASDGRGGVVSTSFTWTVTNPAPVAANDAITTNEDVAVVIPVLANDADPDGDTLTVTAASAGNGTVVINPDGTLRYTPAVNFNGTDTIIYTITDSEGGTSTATVTVTVNAVNDAPTTIGLPNQNDPDASTVSVPVASAFSDLDGDSLNFAATGLPPGLSIDLATGLISGTLTPGDSNGGPNGDGSYTVTVYATDPSGKTVSTTFVWLVRNVPPIANDDISITNEDTAVTVAVLTNDSDVDGDTLSLTTATATHGTVVINGDNTITFTPDADFNGVAVVTYSITDTRGEVATATVTITVNAVNDAPDSVPLPNETNQDGQPVSVNTGSFFSDRDGDTLAFSATGLPAGLSIDPATGLISGTIDKNASQPNGGVYSVTVTAKDPSGLASSRTFTWTITNPAPTATNDVATTAEDTPVSIAVLTNDSDPDADPLTVTSATASHGTVTINPNGTLTYVPDANYNGPDSIVYTISDGNGGTSSAVVAVTVTPVNDPPVAVNDTARTNEDTPVVVPVLVNDSDVDGDGLLVTAASATNGTVVINPDGTVTYTPAANFNGTDTITYTISDGRGGTSTATVTVTVDPVNDAPVAVNDNASTNEDVPVTVSVLSNDSDVDGDPLSVTSATAPNGTVVINPDGTITYTPNANFNGTDTITYTISDGKGGFSTATVTVTVAPVNDAPTATPIASQTSVDSAAISVPTAGNFADLDGNTLTYTAAGLPAGLSINASTGVISGTIDHSASQLNGGVYSVTVTAADGNGGTVSSTFSWTVTNPAPVATNDSATTSEDTPTTVAVLANDSDPDGDALSVVAATAINGTVVINPNGTITYTPNANFNGTDTITYTISDGEGGTSIATVTVTVAATNDGPTVNTPILDRTNADGGAVSESIAANFRDLDGDTLTFSATGLPAGLSLDTVTGLITGTIDNSASQVNGGVYTVTVTASDGNGGTVSSTFSWTVTNPGPAAGDDSATTNEDTPVTVSVLANDSDPDSDPLTVASASAPNGTVVVNPDGTITYTPNANFNGTDTITYTISDGEGGTATATVTVTVLPVNDAPVVTTPVANQANLDGATVSVPVAAGFSDIDGDTLTYNIVGLPAGLSFDPVTGIISGTIDKAASQVNGGVYTVTVTADDGNGGTVSTSFGWTVSNPPPVASNDTATTNEDAPVTIAVLANDNDPDGDALTVTSATAPNGTVVINPDGSITYTPALNFNGTDTITYTISDGEGGTSTATVTVTVVPQNDAPTVSAPLADRAGVDGTAVSIATAASFTDLDGDTLSYSASGLPLGLSIDPVTGLITGTVDKNASQIGGGVYTVTVTADDGNGGTVSTSFTYTVTNPGPSAANDTATTDEDTPVTISVLANDSDPDGDTLTVTTATAGHGTVVINPDGTISYTPNANFNGTDVISYTISDGQGGTATASVTVTVAPVNDAPTGVALPNLFDSNSETVSYTPGTAFSDLDGDTLSFSATGLPAGISVNPLTGALTGQIDAAASAGGPLSNGVYSVTITADDGNGGSVSTTFTWTIVNTPPLAADDTYTTDEDVPVTMDVLANDVDPDGNATTPILITSVVATHGSAFVNPDNTITFTPDPDFNGVATVTYTISDGLGGFSTASATITITPVNDAPDAITPFPDRSAVDSEVVSVPLGAFFSDRDAGDTLTYSALGLPPGLSINPTTGEITGTIDKAASQTNGGVYNVSVFATDSGGLAVGRNFTWTVANPAPVAANDVAFTDEDAPVTIPVLANDTDPDGDTLSVTSATASHGSVVVNGDGTITYTPDADFNGTDTITYTISDGNGGTSSATVAVTVGPVNDAPTATPLPPRSAVDAESVSIPTAANFADVDGDTLSFSASGLPVGLSIDAATGLITGTIDKNASQIGGGIYTITVTADDGNGGTVSTSFTYTVTNPGPTATNDVASTAEDTPVTIPVLSNDTDPDGDTLTVTAATAASGTVVINTDGTITYTPNANFNGTDTITYTISDGNGGTSTATVSVTVSPINDAPTATPPAAQSGVDGETVSIPVAASFADLDGDTLTFAASGLPAGLSIDPVTGIISGVIDKNASQPNGGVYTVTVTADDGNGGTVSTSFTFTVTNPAPTAVNDVASTAEDVPVTIAVLANDTDPDADPLTVTVASAGNGTVVINPDGTITYTPDANFNGTDTITYTISDGNGGVSTAIVTVTVTPVNDAPVANPDTASTNEDTPVTVPVLVNDTDIDGDVLTVTAATAPNGTVVINPDGTITYTPNANFNGTDTITYTISDGNGGTSTATVIVVVAPVNDPPVAVNDVATTSEDSPLVIAPLVNDTDVDGDTLTITSATAPNGVVTINPDGTIRFVPNPDFNGTDTITYIISDGKGGTSTATITVTVTPVNDPPVAVNDSATTNEDAPVTVTVLANDTDVDGNPLTVTTASAPNGTVVINPDGTVTYTPNANFNGTDTITYTISDGQGGTSTATVTVTVNPVNDPPVAVNDVASTSEDRPVTIPVLGNDTDVDGDTLTITAATAPNGTVVINPDGTVTYTPNANFNGTDTITYTISDGNGGTSTATVTVTVVPVNDLPVARPDTASTNEDAPVTISPLANDSDLDGDPLTIVSASASNGTVVINPDGTVTYTPKANFNGTDTITYTISDGKGGTSTATITVSVAPLNDPPVAVNDVATTSEDVPVIVPVLANDADIDGDTLTVTAASAGNGTVVINPNGTVTYTPNANFNGTDTITYTISDGKGGTSTATVSVTVNPVNDPPVAANDVASTNEDTPVTVPVLANDTDLDGNPLTVTAASAPNGKVVINPDGTVTYTPNANFNGTDTITYTLSDGAGGTSTATVTVTVASVNDAPVAVNDNATTNEDTPVNVTVLANDTDVDGDPLTVTAATAPNGTVVINPDGTVTYTPNANFNGTDTITYTISDGNGGTATATVTVTVVSVNDVPIAVNDSAATPEDTPVTIPVLANDVDADGDPLTVTAASAPNGKVVINPDGTITYTPNANFNGTDTITYTISDGKGGTSTATITVTVASVNDLPVDRNETISISDGETVTIPVLANATDADGDTLSVTSATASVGTVVINADGTLTYTAPVGFGGVATITYTVSDGKGGLVTSTVTINVGQVGGDVEQLLGFADIHFPDIAQIDAPLVRDNQFIKTPLIIIDAANGFRSLNGITGLNVPAPLLEAVNGISSLNGVGSFDVGGSAILAEVANLERITDLRFGADRLFDRRFGDFGVEGLTGFSVRELSTGNDQVMIESVVRDRVIYLETRDVGKPGDPPVREYQLRMRDGSPLPEWIHFDARGLAIIERPAGAEEIHLIVRAIREDGKVIDIPVVIQGSTGEIQIDKALPVRGLKVGQALTLDQAAKLAQNAANDGADKLSAAFSG